MPHNDHCAIIVTSNNSSLDISGLGNKIIQISQWYEWIISLFNYLV